MSCDNNQIKQNCGDITYAACTQYQGGVSNESDLDPINSCLSLEETTQDIYDQLDDLSARVNNSQAQGTVTSVNDIDPDNSGNVSLTSDEVPQGSTHLYATSAEKTIWNGKQNSLGFTPVPNTRLVNGKALSSDIVLDKNDVGLGNVQNVDTTIAANIVQTSNYRFVTDAEKALWNSISTEVTEVTYANLLTLKTTSTLVKGRTYLMTDYMTTYTQPVTDETKSSGIIEPLYIVATDVDKLHNVCKSKLYPQDIVYYEITGDLNNTYGTEGFTKGKIYRRVDTIRNNDIGTDWRHVKYDRSGTDKLLFEDYTNCSNNIIREYSLFDNVVGAAFSDNTIDTDFKRNTIGIAFAGNTIKQNFQLNTIGDQFIYNVVGDHFINNTINDFFANNLIGAFFQDNSIADNFLNNSLGDACVSNTIGTNFTNNRVANNLQGNTVATGAENNTIAVNTINNTFAANLANATITAGVDSTNFSSANIYSKTYTNTITKKSNGSYQYTYIDSFGDIVTEDIV